MISNYKSCLNNRYVVYTNSQNKHLCSHACNSLAIIIIIIIIIITILIIIMSLIKEDNIFSKMLISHMVLYGVRLHTNIYIFTTEMMSGRINHMYVQTRPLDCNIK